MALRDQGEHHHQRRNSRCKTFYLFDYFQALIAAGLKELRDKCVFFFAMFNALFVLIVFMLTLNKDTLHIDWPFGVKENITITDDNQVYTLQASA